MIYHHPDYIIQIAAEVHCVPENSIRAKGNERSKADPRRQAMAIIGRDRMYTLQQVGDMFSGRNHATVLKAIATHTALLEDKRYKMLFHRMLLKLGIHETYWDYKSSYKKLQSNAANSANMTKNKEKLYDVITAYDHDGNVILSSGGIKIGTAMKQAFNELRERGFNVTSSYDIKAKDIKKEMNRWVSPERRLPRQMYAGKIVLQPCRA